MAGLPPRHMCHVCGGENGFDLMFRTRGFQIDRCRMCGVGRTVLPDGFDPTRIYDAGYFGGLQDDGYADYAGSRPVLRMEFRATLRRLAAAGAARGGRLIELGCAYGYFLDEARAHYRVCGVEVAAEAAAACRERGLDVATGVLDRDFLRERGPFDVAVLLDVIEHLQRPDRELALLAAYTAPGARLILTTGDWESPISRLMGRHWRLMTPPQHLWFFSPRSIRELLARAGFRVVAIEHPGKFVPLALVLYQLTRLMGARQPLRVAQKLSVGVPVNLFDAMRVVAIRDVSLGLQGQAT